MFIVKAPEFVPKNIIVLSRRHFRKFNGKC